MLREPMAADGRQAAKQRKDLNGSLLLSASRHLWCLQTKFWRAQSSLDINTCLCNHGVVFRWAQSKQLSQHHPITEQGIIPKKKLITSSSDKLRQDRCLPKRRVMFTNREAGKAVTPQLRVRLAPAGTLWSFKVCLDSPLLQENIVPFQQ